MGGQIDLGTSALMADARAEPRRGRARCRTENASGLWRAVGGFVLVAGLAWITVAWSTTHLPTDPPVEAKVRGVEVLSPWVRGWSHWDAGWYDSISRDGYSYQVGAQSSVAFFPLYPFTIRLLRLILPDWTTFARGALISLASGVAAAALLYAWCRRRMSVSGATSTVLLLAVYPYSFYLFGAVYADALFLACTVAAFVLLERGHVAWAVVAAAACTAARPAGLLVAVSLGVRHWELSAFSIKRLSHRRRGLAAIGVAMIGASGLLAFGGYLKWRFNDPFAFASTQRSPGWDQGPGPHTWFKVSFFEELARAPFGPAALGLMFQLVIAGFMLASVPFVRRRLGDAYALLVALIVLFPLIASKDFQGTGRYVLPAFPVFALVGERLGDRRLARFFLLAVGVPTVLLFASWFAKGNYLA